MHLNIFTLFLDNKMKLVLLFTVFITLAAIKAQPVDKEGRTGPTGALDEEWENFKVNIIYAIFANKIIMCQRSVSLLSTF